MSVHRSSDNLDDVKHAVEADTRQGPAAGAPPLEIIEEPGTFILSCELPGAGREDVRVDVSPFRVVLAHQRRADRVVRAQGLDLAPSDFERAVPLPSEVDPDSAEARLNNGVLEVLLPKRRVGGTGVYTLPPI